MWKKLIKNIKTSVFYYIKIVTIYTFLKTKRFCIYGKNNSFKFLFVFIEFISN